MQNLSENLIKTIIDDPTKLSHPTFLKLSAEQGFLILDNGYTTGFRLVFILNASLSALATVTSILLIKHKNLIREDDEKFKQEARRQKYKDEEKGEIDKEFDTKDPEKLSTQRELSTSLDDDDAMHITDIVTVTSPDVSSTILSETRLHLQDKSKETGSH